MMYDWKNAWGLPADKTLLAAGPCSAESEEQVVETARSLADTGVGFFRGGIWKPRTRPGSFEGVGEEALGWMARAREETGLKVGTEVAEVAHVEACLRHELDVLWVGARTTTNPFSVQAIADALKGVDVPVFVKNPMSEDVGLWMGAIERLANAGITRLGAIHRGVTSALETRYRNAPAWKMPIELKRRMPNVPMICDPSHICGQAALISAIAQEAMDLLFDGLMIEVHPDPPNALSDPAQQLTPDQFKTLVAELNVPAERDDSAEFQSRIGVLRGGVDELDGQVIELLAQRMELVREMGHLKTERNVATLQPGRWKEILDDRVEKGEGRNLSIDFVTNLMQSIHEEAIRQQESDRVDLD